MNIWLQLSGIVAIYGVLFYIWYALKTRRGLGAWLQKQNDRKELRLVETLGVSMRTSLLLVEARGQPLLLVVSPQGVQMLPLKTDAAEGLKIYQAARSATAGRVTNGE